jgi:hypothetical protein
LISLYADPETYTQQLRALESHVKQNPNSAQAHFVLAYHYLTEEHANAAIGQLRTVAKLQPRDSLAPQLIAQLERKEQPASAESSSAQPQAAISQPPAQTAAPAPTGKEGKLEGTWTAEPRKDTKITLSFESEGRFTWRVDRQGKGQQFTGKSSYENGVLTLVQDQSSNTMVGNMQWSDDNHFHFKVLGGGPGDPGLSFAKTS